MSTRNEGETMRKRERQARRLLKVCVREFTPDCLQGYVDSFESDELAHPDHSNAMTCALGAMDVGGFGAALDRHSRAAKHVENIFEGWGMFYRSRVGTGIGCYPSWDELPPDTRRRLIYEACVEELARRGAAKVEPEPEKVPA